jgi:hypothetical protein
MALVLRHITDPKYSGVFGCPALKTITNPQHWHIPRRPCITTYRLQHVPAGIKKEQTHVLESQALLNDGNNAVGDLFQRE